MCQHFFSHFKSSISNKWILNDGAMDHVVSFFNLLQNIYTSPSFSVSLPKGQKAIINAISTLNLNPNIKL